MYNEISTVRDTAEALSKEMTEYCRRSGSLCEVIFSCDGSTDGSYDAVPITSGMAGAVEIKRVRSEVNRGKGSAVRRAVAASSGEVVMYTDCDLAYGTSPIPKAVSALLDGKYDVLVGSRAVGSGGYGGYSLLRRAASRTYLHLLALFAGFKMSDSQCGFKVFRGDVARELFVDTECDGWAFDLEVLMLAEKRGYSIHEFPVTVVNHRESRIHLLRDSVKMLSEVRRIKKRIGRMS